MQSYSQNNEQEIIYNYFGNSIGSFLDLGANDGKTLSNSLALIERGWWGTLVEASDHVFERLEALHGHNDKLTLLRYAVGSANGTAIFYESGELLGTGDISLVSSLKTEETKRWTSLNMPFVEKQVQVIDFATLLSLAPYKKYDFVTIDIEGMEKEVVPQIDFKELCTQMAIIEWNGHDADLYDGIMFNFGFKLINTNQENRIYAI